MANDPNPKPQDLVPLNFFSNAPQFYAELDHAANSVAWVDMTTCDEVLAMMCIREQKPYLGFCYSDVHVDKLMARLESLVFTAFQTPGDSMFEAALANILKPANADASTPPRTDPPNAPAPTSGETDASAGVPGSSAGVPDPSGGAGAGGGGGGKPGRGGRGAGRGSATRDQLLATLRGLETGEGPDVD